MQLGMHSDSFRFGGRQGRGDNGQAYRIRVEVLSELAVSESSHVST